MRKIARFVFETVYGPFVAWCCTALLMFGSKKLPEIARSLGKAKGEFKKGTEEGEQLLKENKEDSEKKSDSDSTK